MEHKAGPIPLTDRELMHDWFFLVGLQGSFISKGPRSLTHDVIQMTMKRFARFRFPNTFDITTTEQVYESHGVCIHVCNHCALDGGSTSRIMKRFARFRLPNIFDITTKERRRRTEQSSEHHEVLQNGAQQCKTKN